MKVEAHHSLQDLFGIAIKSEMEAQETYSRIEDQTKNFVLKEKMHFLTGEEAKHETILRELFKENYPGAEPVIPQESVAPVPAWKPEEGGKISDVLSAAMQTEEDSKTFYLAMAGMVEDTQQSALLKYLAAMEGSHYRLLELEYNASLELEDYDRFDPAVHWGA